MGRITRQLASAALLAGITILAMPRGARAQKDPGKLFSTNCVMCHGGDGSGNAPAGKALGAKDLRSAEIQKESDQELGGSITAGKGKMPAFGKKLQPDDIKGLIAYIRSLKGK